MLSAFLNSINCKAAQVVPESGLTTCLLSFPMHPSDIIKPKRTDHVKWRRRPTYKSSIYLFCDPITDKCALPHSFPLVNIDVALVCNEVGSETTTDISNAVVHYRPLMFVCRIWLNHHLHKGTTYPPSPSPVVFLMWVESVERVEGNSSERWMLIAKGFLLFLVSVDHCLPYVTWIHLLRHSHCNPIGFN